jgi:hypothetical protein
MNIYKIIVDHKPTTCIDCPLKHSHDCGEIVKLQNTSSGARAEKIADKRCELRER